MARGNIFDYTRVRNPDMREEMALIDKAFAVGKPYTLTTSTTLATTDLGKRIRVNAAGNLTITFPAVGPTEDGGTLEFIKQGAGTLTNKAGVSDFINSYSVGTGSDITASQYATILYEYVDGLTRWVSVSHEGTWASA
jgi:hypothetical protein